MKESISMSGVVFMKFVSISNAGLSIYVSHSAKVYEETNAGMFNPLTGKVEYAQSVSRADAEKQYTGMYIEINKEAALKMDELAPMWIQTGFPIFNKKFFSFVVRKEKGQNIHKVGSAELSNKEIETLAKNFNAKYPKYMARIMKNYEAKVAKGEYKSLAKRFKDFANKGTGLTQNFTEDIFGRSPFEDTEPEAKKYPFTKMQVNRAKKRQVQDWCELVDIDYSNFKTLKEAKAYLNGLEGMQ